MSLESAKNKAWAHNFIVDIEKFVRGLVDKLNEFVPRDNIFNFEWNEKERAFIIQLRDSSIKIWMGPRVVFSKDRGNVFIYSILLNLDYKEEPSSRYYKRELTGDYRVSNDEIYSKDQLKKVLSEIESEVLSKIKRLAEDKA